MSQRIRSVVVLTASEAEIYKTTGTVQHLKEDGTYMTVSNDDPNILVLTPESRLQVKQVTPSDQTQVVTYDDGYDGLASVTVNSVGEIPNLRPENIKKGVTILGETGTFSQFPNEPTGGVYFYDEGQNGVPRKCKIYKWLGANFPVSFKTEFPSIEEIEFVDCESIVSVPNISLGYMNALKRLVIPQGCLNLPIDTGWNCPSLIEVVLPEGLIQTGDAFGGCGALQTINIPSSLTLINGNLFNVSCISLEFVTIGNGFNCNGLKLNYSTKYSVDTIVSWFNALADRTGETTYTLTIGSTNLNKLTAEQIAIATDKNWTLA